MLLTGFKYQLQRMGPPEDIWDAVDLAHISAAHSRSELHVHFALKHGKPTPEYRVFWSGPGGIGKSHIHHQIGAL